jgi:bacteriorhodopsin
MSTAERLACSPCTNIIAVTMGSNLGFTPIQVEYSRSDPVVAGTYRSIFYVRYIDWFITTPLLLLDLLLTAGMPWPTLLWVIVVDWIMVRVIWIFDRFS